MEKTLGQIAHEAHQVSSLWKCPWEDLTDGSKAAFEVVALAVAAAVKEEDARICDRRRRYVSSGTGFSVLSHDAATAEAGYCADDIRASIKEVK